MAKQGEEVQETTQTQSDLENFDFDFGDFSDLVDTSQNEQGVQEESQQTESSDEGLSEDEKNALKESQEEESGEETQTEEGSEEEEQEYEEDTEDTEETGKDENDGTDTTLRLWAESFRERGILPQDFDVDNIEGDTPEEQVNNLLDSINDSIEEYKNSYKKGIDQYTKEVHDLIEQGVDPNEAKQRVTDRAKIEQITDDQLEENEDLQEHVLRVLYSKKNYSEKDIDKFVKRSRDAGQLYEDSKDAHQELPEIYKQEDKQLAEEQKKERERQEKEREKIKEQIHSEVDNMVGQEIFPGVQVSQRDAQKVEELMTQPVDYEENQNGNQRAISREEQLRRENPIEFKKKLDYLIYLGFFNKDADLSKIRKKQESATSKKIAQRMKETEKKQQKKSTGGTKQKGAEEQQQDFKLPDLNMY